jgi:dienelactone hydrolase
VSQARALAFSSFINGGATMPMPVSEQTNWPSSVTQPWRWTCTGMANKRINQKRQENLPEPFPRTSNWQRNASGPLLQAHETTDASRSAAIGYCFGGGVVLNMARTGIDLDAVVSFHGSLGAKVKAKPGAIKARILVCNGAEDPFVSKDAIASFTAEMKKVGADMQFKSYAGAKHSYTNPDADTFGKKFELPLAYSKSADDASWADMQALFNQCFDAK